MPTFWIFVVLSICTVLVKAQFMLGGLIMGGGAIGYKYYNSMEACNSYWIHQDPDDVERALNSEWKKKVFGQDLALKVIRNSLLNHLKKVAAGNSEKPLVLSFHGGLGTGKTFVTDLLANLLFKEGENSSFVRRMHLIDMLSHLYTKDEKRHMIKNQIKTTVQSCSQSLIIIEEIDNLEPGIIDVLFSYFDQQKSVGGVDFRKAIFIFSSNTGTREISYETCKQFNLTEQRSQFDAEAFYRIIKHASYQGQSDPLSLSRGGFAMSKLIKHDLINSFVPFLPLEKDHIVQCMEASFAKENEIVEKAKSNPRLKEKFFREIGKKISFHHPAGCSKTFSENGCKRVSIKIGQEADNFFFPD